MNSQHIKSVNTDGRSRKRLVFASSRKRSKYASADTFRTFNRSRVGLATSASAREDEVHNPRPIKKQRISEEEVEDDRGKKTLEPDPENSSEHETSTSNFTSELDIALDRNASAIFQSFHRETWPLVRSLPEILHHAAMVLDLLLAYVLSPASEPESKSPTDGGDSSSGAEGGGEIASASQRGRFVVNHATTDILHLLAVLARDLRHEIHPYLHRKILPRIFIDLLHPPALENNGQSVPLDVSIVEAAFRTVSYVFRYDSEALLEEQEGDEPPCLESIRQYYSLVLASRREIHRRLGAEVFAPLVRKLPDSARRRHLRRLLRALARNSAAASPAGRRLQADAVDGISYFLFELVRGSQGRLHSKGNLVVNVVMDVVCHLGGLSSGWELVMTVSEAFMDRLSLFCNTKTALDIWRTMYKALKPLQARIGSGELVDGQSLAGALRLIRRLAMRCAVGDEILPLLRKLADVDYFTKLSSECQTLVMDLLSIIWKTTQDTQESSVFGQTNVWLGNLLRACVASEREAGCERSITRSRPILIAFDLLSHLPVPIAMKTVGSALMSLAAEMAPTDFESALTLVHVVATTRDLDIKSGGDDELFELSHAEYCGMDISERDILLSGFLRAMDEANLANGSLSRVGVAAQCLAFTAMIGSENESASIYEKVSRSFISLLKGLKRRFTDESDAVLQLSFSLALEALAALTSCRINACDDKLPRAVMKKSMPLVVTHLLHSANSLWTVKSVASVLRVLQRLDMQLDLNYNRGFESLSPNLRSRNHFMRLHTLEIICSFPLRPFIVDFADLDLSSDLDEEPQHCPNLDKMTTQSAKIGICDVLSILLSVESCPIFLQNERQILAQISRIGILGQGGKFPVHYAEAVANHLIGLLHLKFAAAWPVIIRAYAALAKGHPEQAWAPLCESLNKYMAVIPFYPTIDAAPAKDDTRTLLNDPDSYYSRCLAWEGANTGIKPLFHESILMCHEAGVISGHESVDDVTFVDSAWKVLENTPELLARHLDDVVSNFLCFMREQYFSGSMDDPDAREMKLVRESEMQSRPLDGRIDRCIIHQRLVSVLRALSSIKKLKPRRDNILLESIFRSLLSHPDGLLVKLALICLSRLQQGLLLPHQDILVDLLQKGKIRNGLLRLNNLAEEKAVAAEHRRQLLPVLSRILFGRLSAKAVDRTTKNTPSSLRHAVLTFLASFCVEDEELYPFIHLCLRVYTPINSDMITLEQQTPMQRAQFLQAISSASAQDFVHVRHSVHHGFLHMLEAIIAQLGHRVSHFVPVFINILISVIKLHEAKVHEEAKVDEEVKEHQSENDPSSTIEKQAPRVERGTLRSLCFLRLSEIFAKYGSVIDFSPFRDRLWDSLGNSLTQLPASASSSCRVPSLLTLMKTLSSNHHLIELFEEHDYIMPSVIRCLDERSGAAVVETVLEFLDNLLSYAEIGRGLIRPHIPLILTQFRSRLKVNSSKASVLSPWAKSAHREKATWRQELTILCRISTIVEEEPFVLKDVDDNGALSKLLVSLLEAGSLSQNDYANVLNILKTIVLRLDKDSSIDLYRQLSILLGPGSGGPRYTNKEVYHLMASVLHILAKASLPAMAPSTEVVIKLCAVQRLKIDEWDVETIALVLGDLAGAGETWTALCEDSASLDPLRLHPIINICFRFLFEEDGVISRSAVKAIKTLVTVAGQKALSDSEVEDKDASPWLRLLEGTIVPFIRSGMTVKLESVRRFYIILLAEVARLSLTGAFQSANLHSDLACLIRDNEPDLDFFLNITHVQIHRRARALQRLRQFMVISHEQADEGSIFSQQTVSMIFVPIATHAVYESTTKMEEQLAVEAIATMGTLSRLLSWSKYNRLLGTTLNQFDRHVEQERYLVGLICSIIDGFHFQVTDDDDGASAIWRALEHRILPKLEGLLVKEKTDRHGEKNKTLRPSIVVAILKILKHFPPYYLAQRLPRLLTVVCGMLKNRDSNVRDLARTTLVNVTVSLDISFLPDIVRELTVTLTEGYQLHVRIAAIHSILLELSESFKLKLASDQLMGFDVAVPGIIDIIQQDIFGDAQESKDAEGIHVRFVKEAAGSKSQHCLELVSTLVQFRPSAQVYDGRSMAQVIVHPFLERLKQSSASIKVIRRIKECLARIATGFSRNQSLQGVEALSFIYATFVPFSSKCNEIAQSLKELSDIGSEGEETVKPIFISGRMRRNEATKQDSGAINVMEWRPSVSGSALSVKEARQAKISDERIKFLVEDGLNAPKLAGTNRRSTSAAFSDMSGSTLANTSAILFGLQLLHLLVKKSLVNGKENVGECDVFVPILTNFICKSTDLEIVFLALKCLCSFVSFGLPSFEKCAISLSDRAVELLSSSGGASNQNVETTQFCFKLLSYLMDLKQLDAPDLNDEAGAVHINDDQMEILLSYVRISIIESEHYSAAFRLLKAMMSRRYVSSAFYDLMEILLEQSVRASRISLRDQSASVFANFLLNYPMSKERIEQHLKQVVLNIKYDYTEGRLSAIQLLSNIISKLPQEMLEHYRQQFFLPLTMQLANDPADECRVAIANCISLLLARLSTNSLKDIFEYLMRWSKSPEVMLARTSLQIFGLFVESCTDFFQQSSELVTLLQTIEYFLQDATRDWGTTYFALISLEKIFQRFVEVLYHKDDLWLAASYGLSGQHPWVRRVSCRLMANYFNLADPEGVHFESSTACFVSKHPDSVQKLAVGLCSLVSLEEEEYNDALTTDIVKSMTWVLRFLHRNPTLFAPTSSSERSCDGVEWLVRCLSTNAKNKGNKRRETIYKCFASFASFCGEGIKPHLPLIIAPLHRSELEAQNELELPHLAHKERIPDAAIVQESRIAKDVLHLLEQKFDTDDTFVTAYSAVKVGFHEKKEKRKLHEKIQLVTNPETQAKRKMKKHERERQRHKRRVQERRLLRGGQAKRQHVE